MHVRSLLLKRTWAIHIILLVCRHPTFYFSVGSVGHSEKIILQKQPMEVFCKLTVMHMHITSHIEYFYKKIMQKCKHSIAPIFCIQWT